MSNFSLVDAIMGIAARNAEQKAVETLEASHTYSDLVRLASQCARRFVSAGIAPGDRIAIAVPKADEVVIAMLASWMVGATCMVIDFRTRRPEKAVLASSFGIRAIVEPNSSPSEQEYLSIPAGESLADAVASESGEVFVRPAAVHPAIIIRTSGTTGTPVGVVYGHDLIMRMYWAMSQAHLGLSRGLFVHAMPMFYAAGIVRTISQLIDGSPVHILPSISSAEEVAERVLASKARQVMVVPPQLQGLLELSKGRSTPMFPDLDAFNCGGGKIPDDISVRAYRELSNNFQITYGASICGTICVLAGDDIRAKSGSVGRPMKHTHTRITDFDGRPLEPGEAGLISIRSPTLADAVIGEARAMSDRMVDGWAVPGDLGFLDEDGFLFLTGRASDMIIRKGVNVYPREIESILERHDDVVEVAAVGYPDKDSGEEIAAFVVVRPGITIEMLNGYVQANIVADKRPRLIRIVDKFPRNDAGKIIKRILVEELAQAEI